MAPSPSSRVPGWPFLLLALGAAAPPVPAAQPPMSFEEVMTAQRRFDEVRFSPDGRYLAYSETHSDAPTLGLSRIALAQHASFVADLATGRVEPIGGPDPVGAQLQFCSTWSPDGRYATVLTTQAGQPVMGAWEASSRRLRTFRPPPSRYCGDWVGDRFVYATTAGGPPSSWALEDALGALTRRWRSAWTTPRLEATVHSNNPAFAAPRSPDGGLALADPQTGATQVIDRGAFYTVKVAPRGRLFAAVTAADPIPDALDRLKGRRGELRVYRLTPQGAVRVIALADLDVGHGAIAWSPDGTRLLAAGRKPGEAELKAFVLDVATGAVRWITTPPGVSLADPTAASFQNALQLGWVDGAPAFIGRSAGTLDPASGRGFDSGESQGAAFRLYGTRGGATAALTGFTAQSVNRFAEAPTGDALVVADGGLWAVSPAHAPRRIGPTDLRVDALADGVTDYGQGFAPALRQADGGQIAVVARAADGARQVTVLDLATGVVRYSTPAKDLKTLSPRLDASAAVLSQGWSAELVVSGAGARTVARENASWKDRPVGLAKSIAYRAGGRDLKGWVVLPPGYVSGRRPALVWIYGSKLFGEAPPVDVGIGYGPTPLFNAQLWAAQGYAVILPSTPLARGSQSDMPKALAEASVAAVDAATAQGWVDPSRVGIVGHSFGGYSTAAVLSERSDRFRAGLALSGVFDAAAAWGTREAWEGMVDEDGHSFVRETKGYVEEGLTTLDAPPWRATDAYLRNSPFYRVATIKAPMMLMVGDLDLGITELHQTERFYAALVREGNPAVAIRYWGQGHVQLDPAAVRDQWARASAWFAHYLGPPDAP